MNTKGLRIAEEENKKPPCFNKWINSMLRNAKAEIFFDFFDSLYRRWFKYPFHNFITGMQNLIKWRKVIWEDRYWDHTFILKVLQHKLQLTRYGLVKHNIIADIDLVSREIQWAIMLTEKVRTEFYRDECPNYYVLKRESKLNGVKFSKLKLTELCEAYLEKYPSTVRFITRSNANLPDKPELARLVAQHNHEKAKRLLFKVLEYKMEGWWD